MVIMTVDDNYEPVFYVESSVEIVEQLHLVYQIYLDKYLAAEETCLNFL